MMTTRSSGRAEDAHTHTQDYTSGLDDAEQQGLTHVWEALTLEMPTQDKQAQQSCWRQDPP